MGNRGIAMQLRLPAMLTFVFIGAVGHAQTPIDTMTDSDLDAGESVFRVHCARCHGMQGEGGEGSNLARPRLRHANDDQQLYDLVDEGIPGTGMPGVWAISDEQRWQVTYYVRSLGQLVSGEMPGDPIAGKAIYQGKGGCPACHIVDGQGRGIGPELTLIGEQRGAEHLRVALDAPSESQPSTAGYMDFLTVRAQTDYADVEGMRINEDAFSVQIRDIAGQVHSFRKSDLVGYEKVFAHSLMPEYTAVLSEQERDDLVSYLMTLRSEQ